MSDDRPVTIPQSLTEHILLGPVGDRRQVQDSPILADVWIAYAQEPWKPQELLITPDFSKSANLVACELDDLLTDDRKARRKADKRFDRGLANIAYLQGIVAAKLYFDEVLKLILPATDWWDRMTKSPDFGAYLDADWEKNRFSLKKSQIGQLLKRWVATEEARSTDAVLQAPPAAAKTLQKVTTFDRYMTLAGIILWAMKTKSIPLTKSELVDLIVANIEQGPQPGGPSVAFGALAELQQGALEHKRRAEEAGPEPRAGIWFYQLSLNRRTSQALAKSVPAVKADAARGLFNVDCSDIAWAVVDSGVKGDLDCFKNADGDRRVRRAYDFSRYREIVSLDNRRLFGPGRGKAEKAAAESRLDRLVRPGLEQKLTRKGAGKKLFGLADDLRNRRPIDWETVALFVTLDDGDADIDPPNDHGTHVAGIIGAARHLGSATLLVDDPNAADGMCPDIRLYDFRVIADSDKDTEFSVIAALQFIRHLNARREFMTIHGVNLSLSIQHDVRNYACGRTPVCLECERLVESGVVVVAAAGNFGYRREGDGFGSYADQTITDPGNADGVITVGSTHRYSPHTFGVSFFSSRGPTGDGRLKPDLVAPGERICGPFRSGWGDLDGTSMSAPHVSGAAAMLMARYPELIGEPRRIKKILCESATDLGRERSFQGHGMLDVLRAFQSI